ncbi:hypothetical protein [Pseudoalteromonas agarivorans]|uniref:hypothetical protein n=1 Tax=Pseudoalteromonas agarivorans TaxID=176102 RepID=UPI00249C2B47|nr:hypothetical protein [Pseudoalteromonas agarivorans]MCP4057451.1 hypothetical protein [Pseudoalteromonas sp.]MDI3243588.1 hypothetical protein [Pseudoalteromonas agarivorans]
MTAKQLFRIIITASLLFPPLFFIAWDENLDPPFIANTAYDFLTHKLFPVLSVVLSFAAGMYGYKKYNACITFKSNFKDYLEDDGKLRGWLGILFIPVLVYLWLWASFCISVKLWTYYYSDNSWQQEYQLLAVEACPSDYEYSCAKLVVLDLQTYRKRSFRWYLDKPALKRLKNEKINIVGVKSPLGNVVHQIQW